MRIPLESRHSDAHIGHSKNGFPLSQGQAPLDLYLHSKVDSRVATVHSTRIMMVQLILKHLVIINLAISTVVFAEAYHSPSANSSQPSQKAPRPIAESSFSSFGVQFNCSKDQIQKLEKEFNQLFSSYGWLGDPSLASLKTSTEGTQLNIHLNTPLTDTDTLTLHNRAEFKINPDIDRFVDRSGKKHDYKIADEKEIVASMLQRGRLFEFEKSFCSFEKFLEHIKIRQNIIRWGIRALWKFPEDGSKTNTKLWASDWKLQPGVKSSEAIEDAFIGKLDYEMGCTKACQLILAQGILDYYKHVKKDLKMAEHLDEITSPTPLDTMEMWVNGQSKKDMVKEGTLVDRHFKVPADHWVPGDWGWIKNPDDESAAENGLEGANIVYIGRGLFVVYYENDHDRTLDEGLVRVYRWRRDFKEQPITADLIQSLRKDPREGGLLRDVRDFPKNLVSDK